MPPNLTLFWNCFALVVVAIAVLMIAGGDDGGDPWDGAT